MPDQAHGLRALADQTRRSHELDHPAANSANAAANPAPGRAATLERPAAPDRTAPVDRSAALVTPRKTARMIAVTSGKGGVGKTNFCTNLAILLARSGQRVIVLDADLGLANLHVVLGVTPRYHLEHVMRGERTLREVLYPAPCGIQIIAGGSGIAELANLDEAQRQRFVSGLSELDELADIILIDTGAGLSHNVLAFVLAVEEVIVVTTPEPTALTDAYATIKVITRENPEAKLRLVVNMAASEAEAIATADRLRLVSKQFLNIDLEVLGFLPLDAAVPRAVRAQRPVALDHADAPMARGLSRVADALGYQPVRSAGINGFLNRVSRFFNRG